MTILGRVGRWPCSLPIGRSRDALGGICPSEMDDADLPQHSLWRVLGCEGPGPFAQDGVQRNWPAHEGHGMVLGFQSLTVRSHLHDGSFGSFRPCAGVSHQASPFYGGRDSKTRAPHGSSVAASGSWSKGPDGLHFLRSPGSKAPSRTGCYGLSSILPPLFYISVHFVEDDTGQNASTL